MAPFCALWMDASSWTVTQCCVVLLFLLTKLVLQDGRQPFGNAVLLAVCEGGGAGALT